MSEKLLTDEEVREQEKRENSESVKRQLAENAEFYKRVQETDETLIEETETKERQKRFADALEFLSDEKWHEIQETIINPMQTKLDEVHERLNQWRDDHSKFVNYVVTKYRKALLDAVKKELDKWEKETFKKRIEELDSENRTIAEWLHEVDSVFEDIIISFAERLGKQEKAKKRKTRSK